MKCLFCGCEDSKVIDSRSADEGRTIRRRRECTNCGKRYTTYETIEDTPVLVVKTSGLVFEDIFGISEHQIIEVLGGDAGFNKRFNVVENQSRIAAGSPDAFDLFWGLNKDIVKH